MEKIFIKLNSSDWYQSSSESLWAEPFENNYIVKNIPFYTDDLCLDDVVSVEVVDQQNWVKTVVKRSGHSTYRIFLNENLKEDKFIEYWLPLEILGCSYEKAFDRFYSIDVPANTDINTAYSLLQLGENSNIWEFEEGFFGHFKPTNSF